MYKRQIYSYAATCRYRKLISQGKISGVIKEKLASNESSRMRDDLKDYVSDVYGSVFEDSIQNATDNDINASKMDSSVENDSSWNDFIDKYSNIGQGHWKQNFHKLPFDNHRETILRNLSSLSWIRVPMYIKAVNAHGSLVARRGLDESTPKTSLACLEFAGQLLNYLLDH